MICLPWDAANASPALSVRVAEFRNAVRHSRAVDGIVEKDGEASIMWFEKVLNQPTAKPSI